MELTLTPPIQPRPAGHQEQSQEQLTEQAEAPQPLVEPMHGDNQRSHRSPTVRSVGAREALSLPSSSSPSFQRLDRRRHGSSGCVLALSPNETDFVGTAAAAVRLEHVVVLPQGDPGVAGHA